MTWRHILAFWAILAGAVSPYFFIFWHWFDFWRRHRALWYLMIGSVFAIVAASALAFHRVTFGGRLELAVSIRVIGWIVLAAASAFGFVADRQIGFRVRSFRPFFEKDPHVTLKTTGAYGVVRHPIYVAGFWFQLGVFLVTGYPSIVVTTGVYTLGALWFTRREEEKLMTLLDDPSEYDRYRQRVPALFPRVRPPSS